MTEHGETIKSHAPFETFNVLEEKGYRFIAALGYQALAWQANNSTLAASYFERSVQAIQADINPAYKGVPTQENVLSHAMHHVAPLARNLTVGGRISDVSEVASASQALMKDLGKHARASKKLILDPNVQDEALMLQRTGLIPALNIFAVQGLLMRAQTDILQTNDWMALPAFREPDQVRWINDTLDILPMWHINIFAGTQTDFERVHKIYVRHGRNSDHDKIQDRDTAVVWVSDDLRLQGEEYNEVGLHTITDLQSKTKSGKNRAEKRAEKLLDAIEKRTIASIKKTRKRPGNYRR